MRFVNKPETEVNGLRNLEANTHVHCHTIIRKVIGAHSSHCRRYQSPSCRGVGYGNQCRHALRRAASIAATEVDDIVAIATQTWKIRAIAQIGEEVRRDEWDEVAAGVVVQHQAIMSDCVLLILSHWNAHAQIAGDMEISVAFLERDEGIELATPTTLKHVTLAGRDCPCENKSIEWLFLIQTAC